MMNFKVDGLGVVRFGLLSHLRPPPPQVSMMLWTADLQNCLDTLPCPVPTAELAAEYPTFDCFGCDIF